METKENALILQRLAVVSLHVEYQGERYKQLLNAYVTF